MRPKASVRKTLKQRTGRMTGTVESKPGGLRLRTGGAEFSAGGAEETFGGAEFSIGGEPVMSATAGGVNAPAIARDIRTLAPNRRFCVMADFRIMPLSVGARLRSGG